MHKILFLQSTSEISGTDITLLRTLEHMDFKRFKVSVIVHRESPFTEDYRKLGCKVHVVPQMRQLSLRRGISYIFQCLLGYFPAVFKLAKIMKESEIDLVHTNTIHNLYGFLAAKIAGRPHVWHIREIVIQSAIIREVEVRLVEWFSDVFIVMDDAIAEAFRKGNGGFPKNMRKLYDGVDLSKFSPEKSGERIRSELGLSKGVKLVGTVCRLDPWKGLDTFVEAASQVHQKMPEVKFWICGGGIPGHDEYEKKLKQKAKEMNVFEAMLFTGWTYSGGDTPEVYAALDVSVHCPIYPEPYGLVNIEAMASGKPLVAGNQGGPPELCGREAALLVPPGDANKTASAILEILKDSEKAQRMALASRKRAEELFNHQKCVDELMTIYNKLLTEKKL